MSHCFKSVVAAAVILLWTGTAFAGPVTLDFTNSTPWLAANNQTSFSTVISGITVTLTASGGSTTPKITFNNSTSERSGCQSGWTGSVHDLACGGDGLGIGDDEITEGGSEKLTVTFSAPVQLTNIELLDLFNNSSEVEKALISLDNGASYTQFTSTNGPGGYYSTNLGGWGIARIIFKGYSDSVSDYALARISFVVSDALEASVPEPGATGLLVAGLFAFKAIRRRQRRRSDRN